MAIKKIFFLFFILFFYKGFCQTNFDKKIQQYIQDYQFESAYALAQKAIAKSPKNSDEIAGYYLSYARILKPLSKSDSCYYYLNKAEAIFQKNKEKNKENLFSILTLKAETARYYNNFDLAFKYIYEATKLEDLKFNSNSLAYFRNRKLAILSQNWNGNADTLVKIRQLANQIINGQNKISNKELIAYTENELGFIEFHRDTLKSLNHYLKAFEIAKKYNCKIALADISINLGRFYQQKRDDQKKAIYYHKIAFETAKKTKNIWQAKEAAINLRICYSLAEDYKTAMFYADTVSHYIYENDKYESELSLKEAEKKYNYESKEKELYNSKKNMLYLLILLVSLVTGLGLMYFYNRKIKKANIQLSKLHAENEFLISETNHRVNNNLQLIAYLITEVSRKKENKIVKNEFLKLLSKVESIATLHRHLYLAKNEKNINLKRYLEDIKRNFENISLEETINLNFKIDDIEIHSDQAVYIGLLVAELFVNSIKHAFQSQQEKRIVISIHEKNGIIAFIYQDNGEKAIGKTIQPKLIDQLCLQLEIFYTIDTTSGFQLIFSKDIPAWV